MSAVASSFVAKLDVVETALASGHFSTFFKAVQLADLTGAFRSKGPFTVFAPTDGAFRKLPAGALDAILQNKTRLCSLVKSHVVSGRLLSQDLTLQAVTLEGSTLNVACDDGVVRINGAKVTKADIVGTNGVIHAIDAVVIPVA